jgi:hypothetical protein
MYVPNFSDYFYFRSKPQPWSPSGLPQKISRKIKVIRKVWNMYGSTLCFMLIPNTPFVLARNAIIATKTAEYWPKYVIFADVNKTIWTPNMFAALFPNKLYMDL